MRTARRSEVLAAGATRTADVYAVDLIAWAVADCQAGDPIGLLEKLEELQQPSIWEQMTGRPL